MSSFGDIWYQAWKKNKFGEGGSNIRPDITETIKTLDKSNKIWGVNNNFQLPEKTPIDRYGAEVKKLNTKTLVKRFVDYIYPSLSSERWQTSLDSKMWNKGRNFAWNFFIMVNVIIWFERWKREPLLFSVRNFFPRKLYNSVVGVFRLSLILPTTRRLRVLKRTVGVLYNTLCGVSPWLGSQRWLVRIPHHSIFSQISGTREHILIFDIFFPSKSESWFDFSGRMLLVKIHLHIPTQLYPKLPLWNLLPRSEMDFYF